MRACTSCPYVAMIGGDYGGEAPIPCCWCGAKLGEWFHRDKDWPKMKDRRRALRRAYKLRDLVWSRRLGNTKGNPPVWDGKDWR